MQKRSVTDRRTDLLTNMVTYRDAKVVYNSLDTQICASLPLNSLKNAKKAKWDRPTNRPTDRPTDQLTNQQTDKVTCRVACTHLKRWIARQIQPTETQLHEIIKKMLSIFQHKNRKNNAFFAYTNFTKANFSQCQYPVVFFSFLLSLPNYSN